MINEISSYRLRTPKEGPVVQMSQVRCLAWAGDELSSDVCEDGELSPKMWRYNTSFPPCAPAQVEGGPSGSSGHGMM